MASLRHLVVKVPVYGTRFAIVIQIEGEKLVPFARLNGLARQACVKLIWQGGRFTSFLSEGGLQCNQVVGTQTPSAILNRFPLSYHFYFSLSTSEFLSDHLWRVAEFMARRARHIDTGDLHGVASRSCNFHEVALLSGNLMASSRHIGTEFG